MPDNTARIISFFIGIVFFIFYTVIINSIVDDYIFNFPYILLTIYFFISIFTLPLVVIQAEKKTEDKNPIIASYTVIFAYLISPVWAIIKFLKNN